MKISSVVMCAFALAAGPASAQSVRMDLAYPVQYRGNVMSAYEIAATVRALDLTPIRRPVWNGDYYVVQAVNWRGDRLRVVIDPERRRVVRVGPAYAGRWLRYGRFGAIAPYYQEAYPPLPPRGLPRIARIGPDRFTPGGRYDERSSRVGPASPELSAPGDDDAAAIAPPPGRTGASPQYGPMDLTPPSVSSERTPLTQSPAAARQPAAAQRSAAIPMLSTPLPRPRPDHVMEAAAPKAVAPDRSDVTGSVRSSSPAAPAAPTAIETFPPVAPLE